MRDQEQFLQVVDRDEAERRFRAAIDVSPRGVETVALENALGRVLAADVVSPVDVPSFDRSNVDGYAVVAQDTFGASEQVPRFVSLADETVHTAVVPVTVVHPGHAVAIATGGMMPRGADAVVMIEHADVDTAKTGSDASTSTNTSPDTGSTRLRIGRAVTAGSGVSFAGTDITRGETVLRVGQVLTSRDTGVLAAIGVAQVDVWRRPIVAILSTGDEIINPGEPMTAARVYDSNAQVLADAVRELGGEPLRLGIVADEAQALRTALHNALDRADIVLLSGGTSKGGGDVSYRIVAELPAPGIVAHGVALKPGKPICLASAAGRPVVVLPGFPTSAIFTFHEFVAPVVTAMAGRISEARAVVQARLAVKVNSEIGRTEYLLVGLVETIDAVDGTKQLGFVKRELPHGIGSGVPLSAYPMGQGSGSVTTFSRADGFTTIGRHEEIVAAGTPVTVHLLGRDLQLADLVCIGSHCIGLDYLLGRMQQRGCRMKFMAVGSTAGLDAARRGECDLAGIHLLDTAAGEYNRPFLTPDLELIRGYGRLQGIVFRPGDQRFDGLDATAAMSRALADPTCVMVNRNQGSGTRVLIDRLLKGQKPAGYAVQPRNHNAVAAAVAQGRADWGVTLDTVGRGASLGFIPVQHEHFDFVVPNSRSRRPAIAAFRELIGEPVTRKALIRLGMTLWP